MKINFVIKDSAVSFNDLEFGDTFYDPYTDLHFMVTRFGVNNEHKYVLDLSTGIFVDYRDFRDKNYIKTHIEAIVNAA